MSKIKIVNKKINQLDYYITPKEGLQYISYSRKNNSYLIYSYNKFFKHYRLVSYSWWSGLSGEDKRYTHEEVLIRLFKQRENQCKIKAVESTNDILSILENNVGRELVTNEELEEIEKNYFLEEILISEFDIQNYCKSLIVKIKPYGDNPTLKILYYVNNNAYIEEFNKTINNNELIFICSTYKDVADLEEMYNTNINCKN